MQAHPGQAVGQRQAPPAIPNDKHQKDTLLKSLEVDGKLDIYAFAVSSIIKCKYSQERRHHARPMVAVLATFALQMGLLILLWQAFTMGSKTGFSTPEDVKREGQMNEMKAKINNIVKQVEWLSNESPGQQ